MAGRVIAQRQVQRPEIELQLAEGVHLPEEAAGLAAVGGHQPGVVVVDQLRIFVRQAQRGGRLGGDDVIALPHRFGQNGDVVLGDLSGRGRAHRRRSTPCPPASDRDGRTR